MYRIYRYMILQKYQVPDFQSPYKCTNPAINKYTRMQAIVFHSLSLFLRISGFTKRNVFCRGSPRPHTKVISNKRWQPTRIPEH